MNLDFVGASPEADDPESEEDEDERLDREIFQYSSQINNYKAFPMHEPIKSSSNARASLGLINSGAINIT